MVLLHPEPEVARILVVALLAHWLQVHLVELGLDRHPLVAGGAGKLVYAPGLVQGREHVASNDLVVKFLTLMYISQMSMSIAIVLIYERAHGGIL